MAKGFFEKWAEAAAKATGEKPIKLKVGVFALPTSRSRSSPRFKKPKVKGK